MGFQVYEIQTKPHTHTLQNTTRHFVFGYMICVCVHSIPLPLWSNTPFLMCLHPHPTGHACRVSAYFQHMYVYVRVQLHTHNAPS